MPVTASATLKDSATGLQSMAARVIPPVSRIKPETFGKMLSYSEMTLGAALLAPFLPSRLVGVGLGIFSGSLLTMYRRTPRHDRGRWHPTEPEGDGAGKGRLDVRHRRRSRAGP
jgi:hypothetical protein